MEPGAAAAPRTRATLEQQAEVAERLLALTRFGEAAVAGQQVLQAAGYVRDGAAVADRGAAVFAQAMFELGRRAARAPPRVCACPHEHSCLTPVLSAQPVPLLCLHLQRAKRALLTATCSAQQVP